MDRRIRSIAIAALEKHNNDTAKAAIELADACMPSPFLLIELVGKAAIRMHASGVISEIRSSQKTCASKIAHDGTEQSEGASQSNCESQSCRDGTQPLPGERHDVVDGQGSVDLAHPSNGSSHQRFESQPPDDTAGSSRTSISRKAAHNVAYSGVWAINLGQQVKLGAVTRPMADVLYRSGFAWHSLGKMLRDKVDWKDDKQTLMEACTESEAKALYDEAIRSAQQLLPGH